eukprot:2098610-Rhodomonas_salina.2
MPAGTAWSVQHPPNIHKRSTTTPSWLHLASSSESTSPARPTDPSTYVQILHPSTHPPVANVLLLKERRGWKKGSSRWRTCCARVARRWWSSSARTLS